MSFLAFLFLFFLIFFIIIPLAKAGYALWRARRSWNDAMNRFRHAAGFPQGGGTAGSDAPRRNGAPGRRKKKISPDTGEYVAFVEINDGGNSGSATKASGPGAAPVVEDQIQDVTWEDIK